MCGIGRISRNVQLGPTANHSTDSYCDRRQELCSGWPMCMKQSAAWTANVELYCLHHSGETKDIFIFGCQRVWELLKPRYINLHITLHSLVALYPYTLESLQVIALHTPPPLACLKRMERGTHIGKGWNREEKCSRRKGTENLHVHLVPSSFMTVVAPIGEEDFNQGGLCPFTPRIDLAHIARLKFRHVCSLMSPSTFVVLRRIWCENNCSK